ncbi:MAG: acyl-CoA/acyl-ACP dehydrogenase [Acidobacteriota bacterium]
MDFDLSKPQKMLQDSVKEFLSRHCPLERVRELMETPTAHDPELWEGLTDQGWVALTLPEAFEGLELGAVDLAVVTEAMGASCMPGPFLSNALGAEIVARSGNNDFAAEVLPSVADGATLVTLALLEEKGSWDPEDVRLTIAKSEGGLMVTGTKLFVADAESADLLLVVGRLDGAPAVVSVPRDAAGLTVEAVPAIDATRKLYRVVFDAVVGGTLVARGEMAAKALHDATRLATVAVCAELVGGMQWVLDTSVEYAKTREQFGRVIGSFQAVQHHCADMLYLLENARPCGVVRG